MLLETREPDADTETASTLLIDGKWKPSSSSETFQSLNPATGEVVGVLSKATVADVDAAVRAARVAFDERRWTSLPTTERAKIIWSIADRMDAEIDELVETEVREVGTPREMARWAINYGVDAFRYFSGWVTKIHGIATEIAAGDAFHAYSRKEPVGVAALIVPWNGPIMLASQKIAPMLAAGCTGVLKPSESASYNLLNLGRIALEAGVPPGVLNIVTGPGSEIGGALGAHPDVDKIHFTGSTEIGKGLMSAAAGNMKRLALELGGKSAVIVMDDADIEAAVPAILMGVMGNTGQGCIAGSRLYAQRGIYDQLMKALAAAAAKMTLGNGLDDGVQLGPVISKSQFDKVMAYIAAGVADGAEVVVGGRQHGDDGLFIEPTILSNPPAHSKVVREEIFGPVLVAMPFDDVEEAIAAANDTTYGLAGAVYTRSLEKAHTIARAMRTGTVFINCHAVLDYSLPFGGYKQSGWGPRENGSQGVEAYMESKSVIARLY